MATLRRRGRFFFVALATFSSSFQTGHSFSASSGFSSSPFAASYENRGVVRSEFRMSAVIDGGTFNSNFGGSPFSGNSGGSRDVGASSSNMHQTRHLSDAATDIDTDKIEETPEMRLAHPSLSTASRTNVGMSHGLLDPKLIGAIRDKVGADDPVLAAFFTDFMNEGPLASMHHLGTPGVASRLSALMGEVVTRSANSVHDGIPTAGWCRRSRFSLDR